MLVWGSGSKILLAGFVQGFNSSLFSRRYSNENSSEMGNSQVSVRTFKFVKIPNLFQTILDSRPGLFLQTGDTLIPLFNAWY